MTDAAPCARPWPTPAAAGRCSPACPARRSPPPSTATATPPPTRSRSPNGSPAAPTTTWPSPPALPGPTSWMSTSTVPPGTATPPSAGSAGSGCSTARRLRAYPQRRPARLLHRHRPAQRPPTRAAPGLPLLRRLHPGSALPGRRPPLPAHQDHRARRHPDWAAVSRLCPPPQRQRTEPRPAPDRDLGHLARWVAPQPEGNRNAGLFWAANRALETDPAADLSPLADAARRAGLGEREIAGPSTPPAGPARPAPPARLPGRGGDLKMPIPPSRYRAGTSLRAVPGHRPGPARAHVRRLRPHAAPTAP